MGCGVCDYAWVILKGRKRRKKVKWRDPKPKELKTPEFNAVWNCIKKWDICVPEVDGDGVYSGATGNHVVAILDALKKVKK